LIFRSQPPTDRVSYSISATAPLKTIGGAKEENPETQEKPERFGFWRVLGRFNLDFESPNRKSQMDCGVVEHLLCPARATKQQ
jgi:hypothetical protein